MHYVPIIYEILKQVLQAFSIKLKAILPLYLIQILSNNNDKIQNHQKAMVYEILVTLASNEIFLYIGETKRKISERLKEHKRCLFPFLKLKICV